MKAIVPLAPGFEEIEAVTIIDVLRRARIEVISAGLESNVITGSHGITVNSDALLENIHPGDFSAIILPGGMPGSKNLLNSAIITDFIKTIYSQGGHVCAICAAPIVLARTGILQGKRATCYPGYESHLKGATLVPDPVVIDDRIITGKGPGCAIPFALAIIEVLIGNDPARNIKDEMQIYWY